MRLVIYDHAKRIRAPHGAGDLADVDCGGLPAARLIVFRRGHGHVRAGFRALHKLSRLVAATPPTTTPTTATAPAMRPSAATAPATAPSSLEARVELLDRFADQTKTPGIITLALFDQPPATHKGDLIQSWTFSLNGPQDNSKYWDRTMRGYFFKLPLIQPPPKREHLLLTVSLILPNGMELTDEMELPVK